MSSVENKLIDEILEGDRMLTVIVMLTVYPEITIKDAFEILEDPLLVETLLIELSAFPIHALRELVMYEV